MMRDPSLAVRRVVACLAVVLLMLLAFVPPAAAVDVQRVRAGDLEAWLVEDHSNPLIAIRFAFRGGAASDPEGKAGLATMTASLLDEGAGDLDSQAFQRRLEDLAVDLGFDADLDAVSGEMRMLTENKAAALELLRLALREPRFDAEPVARIRSQIQALIRQQSENANYVAHRAFMATLFPNHPYGRSELGTVASLDAITADDLRSFVARRIARDNLVIGVVGDITAEELAPLLQSTFGDLPAAAVPADVPDVEPAATGRTVVEQKPVPQSAIVFGHGGPKRGDPDYYAATVVNHLLGGGSFTSRLYEEVREKRGLVYSVYTTPYPLDHAGLIFGQAATANARAAETVQVIRDQWRQMAAGNITAERLADAKTYLTGSFPLRFTSSGSIAAILVGMQLENLGIDYLDRRNGLIEAVTLEEANRVARDMLHPDNLTVVVVGQPEGVEATN